jgi:colicin import membrane protein
MQTYRPTHEQKALAEKDIFTLLGIRPDASDNFIRKAYLRLARQLHPDKTGTTSDGEFKEVHEAYEILKDPIKRQWYKSERLKHVGRQEMNKQQDELARQKREFEARERAKEELAKRKREHEAQERAKEERRRQEAMEQEKRQEWEALAKRKQEHKEAEERAKEEHRRQEAMEQEKRRECEIRQQEEQAKRKLEFETQERANEDHRRQEAMQWEGMATLQAAQYRASLAWLEERNKEHRRKQAMEQKEKEELPREHYDPRAWFKEWLTAHRQIPMVQAKLRKMEREQRREGEAKLQKVKREKRREDELAKRKRESEEADERVKEHANEESRRQEHRAKRNQAEWEVAEDAIRHALKAAELKVRAHETILQEKAMHCKNAKAEFQRHEQEELAAKRGAELARKEVESMKAQQAMKEQQRRNEEEARKKPSETKAEEYLQRRRKEEEALKKQAETKKEEFLLFMAQEVDNYMTTLRAKEKEAQQEYQRRNQEVARIFWYLNIKHRENNGEFPSGWTGKSKKFPLGWIP